MKLLEKGKPPTLEIICPYCRSRLLLEKGDIRFYKDFSGASSPYVDCCNPDCHKSIDVEGYEGISKLY